MRGITFNNLPPIGPPAPGRMDVACFVGFAPLARRPLFSDTLQRWLEGYGWPLEKIERLPQEPALIRNTPVALESWDAFRAVFSEQRLDQAGSVRSRLLADPLPIAEQDRVLHLIADHVPLALSLAPDEGGRLALSELAAQMQSQLADSGASARIDPLSGAHLIIQRNNGVQPGELTVHANMSLGFVQTVQSDANGLPHYAGAAVKAFFRQGGRKCYFISMGDPLPYHVGASEKIARLRTLLWGPSLTDAHSGNRTPLTWEDFLSIPFPAIATGAAPVHLWQGTAHLAGLADVTYLCLPDLVDLLVTPPADAPAAPAIEDKEVFVACSASEPEPDGYHPLTRQPPECGAGAYGVWKRVVGHLLTHLAEHAPTVQLVAGLPLPDRTVRKAFDRLLLNDLFPANEARDKVDKHLQMVFPWLKTEDSGRLPGALEPPEGTLLGMLAHQSRRIGAFRSVAGTLAANAYDLAPMEAHAFLSATAAEPAMADRVSWFDHVPDGIRLQSDVTAVRHGSERFGAVRRIMILIQRAAQRIGLDYVFEPGSERIQRNIRDALSNLLHQIYLHHGLRGRSAQEAYAVSCGRATMTRNDIDNGRLIANVVLQPAVPIERIAVDLLLERDGAVSFGGDTV
ncbi:hypothetical protein [Desulfatitalea alkaliphila]|uniref:Phage tail sheath protein n=1 Tax=Desulfatitalea alkaliphila TaxID=2929485 RepID=A0AA41R2Q5_9BACT|nr:hypothetical protein [Desulfatitalea alkaliphila]MCJ8500110.1 hypothetical protein [Desulfatitalea alkaliphila]